MARCFSGTPGENHKAEQYLNRTCPMWVCYCMFTDVHVVCDRVEKEVGGMEMAHEGMIWSLAWHPLGHILCSGSNDHTR